MKHELGTGGSLPSEQLPAHPVKEASPVQSELTFSVVTSADQKPIAKRFWINDRGELESQTAATLVNGHIAIERAKSIASFAARLDQLSTNQAILHGLPSLPVARVVTQGQLERMKSDERQGVIARTRDHLHFADAPGCVMIDFDATGAPQALLDSVASPEQARDLLLSAVPELKNAPMLWRPSSSSYLYDGAREVQGLRGQRVYLPLIRASDIPSLGNLIYDRLWLRDYGFVVLSASGQLLERTLVDRTVWQPERLDFAAGPVCEPPLERRAPAARLWNEDAPLFDARVVAGITGQEQRSIQAKRKAAAAALRDAAREQRRSWVKLHAPQIAKVAGIAGDTAEAIALEAVEHRVLRSDFLLTSEDGARVAVRDLLADPDVWHGRRFFDPLEPEYRADSRIARANLHPDHGGAYLYSHAHGGVRYKLANDRETIQLIGGALPHIVDRTSAIMAEDADIFQLQDQIVRVTEDGRLATVQPEWIADRLQRTVDFVRRTREGDLRPTDLSMKYAKTILAKSGEIGLPSLTAITNGPFLRPDGSLVAEPGYDRPTGVLYHPAGLLAPPIRTLKSIGEVESVLRQLFAPFREFPFAGDVDRGSALALVLTAALRAGIPTAPGGVIESHEAGSGKTLFAQAVANLTGTPASPQALAQAEEEIRKALFSAGRAGIPAVLFDNVYRDRVVDSASLAMVLTSGRIADRVLGKSIHAIVPFRSLMLLTGNNPRVAGDLNRRLLRVRITPNIENPWTRVFPFDPKAVTEANWLTLRVAVLELVQAALRDGPPSLGTGTGYPEWDFLVRSTIAWVERRLDIGVGFADPAQSLVSGYEDDPERDELRRVLTSWRKVFRDRAVTVKEMLEAVRNPVPPPVGADEDALGGITQLQDVLKELDPNLNGQAIGIYLNGQKGRIVDGLTLLNAGKQSGSTKWRVSVGQREPVPDSGDEAVSMAVGGDEGASDA